MKHGDKPHTGPTDFNEGTEAAARFRHALTHLATVPKAAAPRHQIHHKKTSKKK